MASRTDRFGFLTFDSEADDLSYMGYKAFVADREAIDRLLRVATEAHTHTGVVMSDVPPAAPVLEMVVSGGNLPPNQPITYKLSVVDIYGQERIASVASAVYSPPQVPTPGTPTIASETLGVLIPGDYQYAVSAWTGDVNYETAISTIATGRLRGTGAWIITPPNVPAGAEGWNLYRKGPTEAGFRRIATGDIDFNFRDDGTTERSDQRAPDENTTFTTNSVLVDSSVLLEPGQTARIYRTFDASNWEHSLIGWTAELPYLDTGGLSSPGYPPETGGGVGGAPKIRLGIDTEGHLPGGRVTTTLTTEFNIRGTLKVGYWPWQWVNELDTFHLLGMRANLGRDSVPETQPVRVALESRSVNDGVWRRIVDDTGSSYYAEINTGATFGNTVTFSPDSASNLELGPGDALRIAVAQTGLGAETDRDLTLTVIGAGRHGSTDTSDWSA